MTYRFINDLFPTEEELTWYYSHPFPFNLPLVKERLDKKIEEDSEYEVFLPFYYRKLDSKLKDEKSLKEIKLHYLFISNKGRIISNNNKNKDFKEIIQTVHPGGYITCWISVSNKNNTVVVHRALGCCFVPVSDELLGMGFHPKNLEINHIDGDKTNFELSNLEWMTTSGNIRHAVDTGLLDSGKFHRDTKPVKGRVIRGKFIGFEFVLFGGSNLEQYGFDQAAVSNAANGKLKSHGNVKWTFATEEDIKSLPHELSAEIAKDLKDTCPIAKYKTIGVNIETGEIVEFIGKKKCKELGFNPEAIGNMIAGRTSSHKGHTWRYELLESGL